MRRASLIPRLTRWLDPVCELAFPEVCPGCRAEPLPWGDPFCPACRARLPLVHPPTCPGCGGDNDGIFELCANCLREGERPWQGAVAVLRFEGYGRELIHRFKYRNAPELARPLGRLAAARWRTAGLPGPDCLVPMPLHWTRQLRRGYNQAGLAAAVAGNELGLPVVSLLRRVRRTGIQARLDREDRQRNIAAAFSVDRRKKCGRGSILLFDDVMTTGATLASAARALLEAGTREVRVLVLARD